MEDLEAFIDQYYYRQLDMDNRTPSNPSKRNRKSDSSTDTDDLQTTTIEVSILASINKKLDLLIPLNDEIKEIRNSLEFAHQSIITLQKANQDLHKSVNTLNEQMHTVSKENKLLKETVLDLQTRSMRDNLIFSGIPEQTPDDPETNIKTFMTTHLNLPPDTVNNITFHRVHRLGKPSTKGPRPIIAKFEHFKHKELVKSKGKELKGKPYGLNDQYPKEINERRKILYPIFKENRQNNKRSSLIVDKLYIDGQLFRSSKITPWLF